MMNPLFPEMKVKLSAVPGMMWHWSAMNQEAEFRYFLDKIKPKQVLEIGTFQGLTAVLLAEYANKVTTIDVVPYDQQNSVWMAFNVMNKIERHVCKTTRAKREVIANAQYDFAYVDGSHVMENVVVDYDCVKNCKYVLFHDYWLDARDWADVKEFVDGLKGGTLEVKVPFALFTKDGA